MSSVDGATADYVDPMNRNLLLSLAVVSFAAALGGGIFYGRMYQENGRLVASAEAQVERASQDVESRSRSRSEDPRAYVGFEAAMRDRQHASEALVQARQFETEALIAAVAAAGGPGLLGVVFLLLGLRARRPGLARAALA